MASRADVKLIRDFQANPESLTIFSLRTLLRHLQSERRDSAAKVEVLEDRLQITNSELAFRRCEADECRGRLYALQKQHQLEHRGEERRVLSEQEEAAEALQERESKIRRCVRQVLQEHITQVTGRKQRDELGFVVHSGPDLMINKSEQEEIRERNFRDTVLVTYIMPYSEQKHHLTYRVAETTTVKTLKEDACTHWGLNEAEFVLKVANNSKAHDALKVLACFRPNEDAHFLLVYKTPKNQSVLSCEYADIVPKIGRKRLQTKREEFSAEAVGRATGAKAKGDRSSNKSLAEEMLVLPGLYRFMTQRDRNVKQHLWSLRLRSACAYFLLVLLTAFSIIVLRPPGVGYECVTGISETMTGGLHAQTFDSIRSEEDIWKWLEGPVPAQIFMDDSLLRQYNYLVGYLQVLIQQVAEPSPANCKGIEGSVYAANFSCVDTSFRDFTADKSQQPQLESHWINRIGQDGRSWEKPWEYRRMNYPTSGAHSETQAFQRTDGSGHRFEYQLQYTPLSVVRSAFMSDMRFLQQIDWLSKQTRALHLSFVAYNANYQTWVWNRYTFEISAYGTIHPLQHIEPFRPHLLEYGLDSELLLSDIVRFSLLLFLILQGLFDFKRRREEAEETESGWLHLVDLQNLVDFSILIFFLVALGFRISYYESEPTVSYALSHLESFQDAGQVAENYGVHVCLEAVLLALCLYRLAYFLRVNRSVFVIWLSVQRSAAFILRLSPLLLLVFLGFVVLGLATGYEVHECNRNFGAMLSCSLLILAGDYHPAQLEPGESARLVYVIALFCFGRLLLANTWLSILMQEYHSARVEAGFSRETYKWKEYDWINWCLPWPLNRVYFKLRPSWEPVRAFKD